MTIHISTILRLLWKSNILEYCSGAEVQCGITISEMTFKFFLFLLLFDFLIQLFVFIFNSLLIQFFLNQNV